MLIRRWSLRGAMRRLRDRDRPSRGEEGRRTRQTSARPERNEGKRRSRSRSPHFSDRDDGDSTHRTLLLTDLDGTLVDHHSLSVDAEIKEFFGYWDSEERTRGSLLCYNTARAASDYRQLVLKYEHVPLPSPDILITGEGAQIWWREQTLQCLKQQCSQDYSKSRVKLTERSFGHGRSKFYLDSGWQNRLQVDWWDSGMFQAVKTRMDALDAHLVADLNHDDEARYAISVKCTEAEAQDLALRLNSELNQCLRPCNHSKGSSGEDGAHNLVQVGSMPGWPTGDLGDRSWQLVTATATMAGKGKAATYVAYMLGLDPGQECIAAGDTAGDASMLRDTNMPFICVANASEDLKELVSTKTQGFVVQANGARGVLDGLRHFQYKA